MQLATDTIRAAVHTALSEDHAADDVTTRWSVPEQMDVEAVMIAKQPGRVAGLPLTESVYDAIDPSVAVRPAVADGDPVRAGQPLAWISGPARSIITGERAALNFVQRMSGIATLTSAFVAAIGQHEVKLLDTRKTAPGLRALDKYAVTCGGGTNHRLDLAAMVLLKENHLAAAGGVRSAVRRVRDGMAATRRHLAVEVEVTPWPRPTRHWTARSSGSCSTTCPPTSSGQWSSSVTHPDPDAGSRPPAPSVSRLSPTSPPAQSTPCPSAR